MRRKNNNKKTQDMTKEEQKTKQEKTRMFDFMVFTELQKVSNCNQIVRLPLSRMPSRGPPQIDAARFLSFNFFFLRALTRSPPPGPLPASANVEDEAQFWTGINPGQARELVRALV